MAEQYANNATTTLSAAITTVTATSISVVSAAGFPSTASYRIIVDSEIMLVTAGAGTTTWTVTRGAEGTTAATHLINSPVTHVLTAASYAQGVVDRIAANPTGRSSTFLVAASNASALMKGQADYLCDGTADDVEIQAAINALPAGGGRVLLSEGQFNLGASIVLSNYLTLEGMGRGTILKLSNAINVSLLVTPSIGTLNLSQVEIARMRLDGNKTGNATGAGIEGNFWQSFIHDLEITQTPGAGIYLRTSVASTDNNRISGCYIHENGGRGIDNRCGFTTITGCYISGMATENFVYATGQGLQFRDNILWAGGAMTAWTAMLSLINVSYSQVRHNSFADINSINVSAISLGPTAALTNVDISDNDLHLATALAGIYVAAPNGFTISDIEIRNNTVQCYAGTLTNGIKVEPDGAIGTYLRVNVERNHVAAPLGGAITNPVVLAPGASANNNQGWLAPGEHRIASGALTAGLANAYAFNWQNPHASKILVKRVLIYLSAAGGTAGALLDVGMAVSTATHSNNLIDSLGINTTGVFDNLNDAGTNGKSRQIVDENGGANDWVTGQILVQNAASLAGRYEIEYLGV